MPSGSPSHFSFLFSSHLLPEQAPSRFCFLGFGTRKAEESRRGGGPRPCRGRERALRCRSVFVSRAAGAKGKKGTEYILVARAQKKPT